MLQEHLNELFSLFNFASRRFWSLRHTLGILMTLGLFFSDVRRDIVHGSHTYLIPTVIAGSNS